MVRHCLMTLVATVFAACFTEFAISQNSGPTVKEIAILSGHKAEVCCVAFSNDGKFLASGGCDKKIRLWELASQKNTVTMEGHTENWIRAVAFSPDDTKLVSYGEDTALRIWDPKESKNIFTLEGRGSGIGLAFQNDSDHVIYSTGSTVEQWNWKRNRLSTLFSKEQIKSDLRFTFTKDHKLRVIGRGAEKPPFVYLPGTIFKGLPMKERFNLLAKEYLPFDAPFSPGGDFVATGDNSKEIFLWECATGNLIWSQTLADRGGAVAFSPDGKFVAASCCVRFARPNPMQAAGIIFLDVATGKEVAAVQAHRARFANISGLAFSRDGKTLASASIDHTIKVFDVSMLTAPSSKAKDDK